MVNRLQPVNTPFSLIVVWLLFTVWKQLSRWSQAYECLKRMKKGDNSLVCIGRMTSRAINGGSWWKQHHSKRVAQNYLKIDEGKLSEHSVTKFSQTRQDAILPLNSSHLVYMLRSWWKRPQQALISCCQVWTSGETTQTRCETHLMPRVESLLLSGVKWCAWDRRVGLQSVVTGCTLAAQLSPAVGGRCSDTSAGSAATLAVVHRNARPTTETGCCPPSGDLRGYPERISSLWFQKYSESQQYRGCQVQLFPL